MLARILQYTEVTQNQRNIFKKLTNDIMIMID
jgi:hypothetical protein